MSEDWVQTTLGATTRIKQGRYPVLTDRRNVVVIADEAHRSQYGFKARIEKSGEIAYGFAKHMRDALPNASFIGFTGTPIEKDDVNTPAVFGDYIDIYDISRAVEDGATVPIYYETRRSWVASDCCPHLARNMWPRFEMPTCPRWGRLATLFVIGLRRHGQRLNRAEFNPLDWFQPTLYAAAQAERC